MKGEITSYQNILNIILTTSHLTSCLNKCINNFCGQGAPIIIQTLSLALKRKLRCNCCFENYQDIPSHFGQAWIS